MRRVTKEYIFAYLLIAPALVYRIGMAGVPLAINFYQSFFRIDPIIRSVKFIGLANYQRALQQDVLFLGAIEYTFIFTIGSVFGELVLGLGIALVLHKSFKGRKFCRSVLLLPWATPLILTAFIWKIIFLGEGGVINDLLMKLGIIESPYFWLIQKVSARACVIITNIWESAPFAALLMLGTLQGILPQLYEAARIDGASWWQRFRFITFPALLPAIIVVAIFRFYGNFVLFALVYGMTGGGPGTATDVISRRIYLTIFRDLRFGYGSCLAIIMFCFTFVIAVVYFFFFKKALKVTA